MAMLCSAYGMRLSCSFPIEGMAPCEQLEDWLPTLTLDRRGPAELDRAWQGTGEEPRWRGRLGDGIDLDDRGRSGGRHALRLRRGARFPLQRAGWTAWTARRASEGLDWQRVLVSKVIPLHQRHARL